MTDLSADQKIISGKRKIQNENVNTVVNSLFDIFPEFLTDFLNFLVHQKIISGKRKTLSYRMEM